MLLSDFRLERGLKWPRMIKEYAGTRLFQETRVEKIVLNPRFPPAFFTVTRRR